MAQKKTIIDFIKMKRTGEQVTWITAYDFPMASFAEQAGMDMILVGDSLGMVVLGYSGTNPVTMDDCISHCQAVRRGAPNTFIVGDMPFGSYQVSDEDAVANACRFLKEAQTDCIKLEGGVRVKSRIRSITDAGIAVIGHIGLTPQSSGQLGGFKAQGRDVASAEALIEDAVAVQEAGAFSILVEAVPPELTAFLRKFLKIPVYSIGAGVADGQLVICGDMLGLFQAFTPKFVKKYANVAEVEINAFKAYVEDVKSEKFPSDEYVYHILDPVEKFEELFKKYL
ncbi:MAG: 3-methyl-2-oxobutanoate hydroxymethyltransferase [Spirochaetaceae bacterium]|jgi:3-methyl-2-oxobutanoate hydroxymethyltransferase|nr:3-methyl-2-oxobutanoate hydroxymethyltransferase [Spirochaetaceae bacterium]